MKTPQSPNLAPRKTSSRILSGSIAAVCAVAAVLSPTSASAALLTWDGNGLGPTLGADDQNASAGIWDTSRLFWWDGSAYVAWGSDAAFFGTSGGNSTVSISGTVNANALTFNTQGYNLRDGILNLTGAGTITTASATTTDNNVIQSLITGSVGLNKLGAATLTLTGRNTYTGTTTVSAGTLRANDGIGLSSAAGLTLNGGILETSDDLIRVGGSGAGQMQITGGTSGFSAVVRQNTGYFQNHHNPTIPVVVALGTLASPDALTWGSGSFQPGTLVLNGNGNWLDFRNSIDLNGSVRTISSTIGDSSNNNSNMAIMSGVLSNGGLTKTGTGRIVLSGNNTYAGATTISAGTLVMRNANALGGTGTGTTVNGGSLGLDGSIVTAAEPVTLTGSGISGALWNISGNNNFTGPITLSGSATIHSTSGLLTVSNATPINIATATTLSFGQGNNIDGTMRIQTQLSGLGAVTRNGDGSNFVWLDPIAGNNTYSGTTIINASNSPTQLRALNGVGLSANSALQIGNGNGHSLFETYGDFFRPLGTTAGQVRLQSAGGFAAVGANIGVAGTGIKVGFGTDLADAQATTVTWGSANFFSGGALFRVTSANTTANMEFVNPINLGNTGATRQLNLAGRANTLDNNNPMPFVTLSGGITGTGNLNIFGENGNTAFSIVLSGVLSHTGTTGFGVGNMGGNMTVSGDNTMTGAVTINSNSATLTYGGVNINHAHALGNAANTVLINNNHVIDNTSGAAITIDRAYPWTMGSVQFRGTNSLNIGTGNVTLNNDGGFQVARNTLTIGGIIANDATLRSLSKSNSGALTLNNANTFGGANRTVTVTGGTLNLGHNAALGNAANTLTLNGGLIDNTSGGSMTLASNYAQSWNTNFAFFTDAVTDNTHDLNLGTGTATNVRNVFVNGAGTLTIGGSITGGQTLVKGGKGTMVLGGAANAQGTTTVNRGTLALNYTANGNVSALTDGQGLTLGGGTLDLRNGSHTEIVSATTINAGGSAITQTGGTSILRMAAISRNAGGTVDFGAASIADTNTNNIANSSGILGGWATIGGASWATSVNAGAANTAITAYASETAFDATANMTGNTVNFIIADSSGALQLTGSNATQALSTLNIVSSTGTNSLDINGKTLTVYTNGAQNIGGLLVSGTAAYEINDTNGTPGQLGTTGQELIVNQFNSGGLTISARIVGNNTALTKAGSQTLILTGANTYTGTTTIGAGTLQIGSGGAVGTLGTGGVTDNGILQFNRSGSITVANTISGYGDLVQAGPSGSTVILTANNTYTGNTIINANTTLQVGSGGGAGQITQNNSSATGTSLWQNNGIVTNNGTLTYNRTGTSTIDAKITGAGALTQASPAGGANILLLTGNGGLNDYTGVTTVSSGVLRADDKIGLSGGSNLVLNGGVWEANGNGGGHNSYQIYMFRAGGTGAGQMQITGGTSGFSAGVTNHAHAAFGSYASPESLTWGSGSFQPSTFVLNQSAATRHLYFWNPIDLNGAARTVAVNAAFTAPNTTTFAYMNGVLSGTGGLTKTGVGLLSLNATNTYTGATTVSTGVLRANDHAGLPGTASAGGGSNLDLNGGAWESQFDMIRAGGTGQGEMQITGGTSGFSANLPVAVSATLLAPTNVAFGSYASPTALTWGTAPFNPTAFLLNAASSNNKLNFMNAVDLNGAVRTLSSTAATYSISSPNNNTATMSGVISGGAGSGLTMGAGSTGTIALTGNNTYQGVTTVNAGLLVMRHANALGDTGSGTVVASGASLGIEGGIVTAAEPLTINGTGGTGALRNLAGNNNYTGAITLGAATTTTIQSDNDTLTLSSSTAISLVNGSTLNFGFGNQGFGHFLVTSRITGGNASSTLRRQGDNENFLWLKPASGVNDYFGTTIVDGQNGGANIRGADGVGLSANSALRIGNGNGRSYFETTADLIRPLGTGAGQMALPSGSAGFAAYGGTGTLVKVGFGTSVANASATTVTWGNANFNPGNFLISDPNTSGNMEFLNPIDLNGSTRTITSFGRVNNTAGVNPADYVNFSGGVTGTGNLQVQGDNSSTPFEIIFSGPLSHTGTTTLGSNSGGNITLSGDNSMIGTVNLNVNSSNAYFGGANLNSAHALGAANNTVNFLSNLVIDNTSGALVTFDRSYNYVAGTFRFRGTNSLNMGTGPVTLSSNPTFTVFRNELTFGGIVSGAGVNLTKDGQAGVLVLTGANTYTGITTVSNGILRANDNTGLPGLTSSGGGSNLTLNGGVWESSANLYRVGNTGQGQMRITGGTSGFSARGAAVNAAFTTAAGDDTPVAQTWGVGSFSPGTLVLNEWTANNTLNFQNAVDFNGSARTVNVNATAAFPATMSGILSGTGGAGLTKGGVGTLILNNANNSYSGPTVVSAGTLVAGAASPVAANGAFGTGTSTNVITLGDATTTSLNSRPALLISGAFNVARPITIANQATTGTYTLGGSNTSGTSQFTGNIVLNQPVTLTAANGGTTEFLTGSWTSNNRAVTVTGAGTSVVQLTNTLSTTAAVNVNSGTFYVNGALNGGGSNVTVAGGATLGGTGSIAKPVVVSSGGKFSPGNSPGTLALNSGLTIDAGGIFQWENSTINTLGSAGTDWDVADITGGTTTISNTATTGSQLKLQFTDGGTSFGNSFWDSNQAWDFITGGVSGSNLFDTTNITIFVNGVQTPGSNNTISGEGSFSTLVSGSNLQLAWTASGGGGNNSKLWVGATEPTGALQTTSTTQAFGRVMLGSTQSVGVTLNSNGSDAATTNGNIGVTGDATSTTTDGVISGLSPVNTTLTTGSTGVKSGTVTITNQAVNSNGASQGSDNGVATINVSGTVLTDRVITASTASFGLVHVGGTGSAGTTLGTSGSNDVRTAIQVANGSSGVFSVTGGSNPIFNSAGSSDGRTLSASALNTAGVFTNAAALNLTPGTEGGVSGTQTPVNVAFTYNAEVFSGSATWTGAGSSWGTLVSANWVDANTINAAPGTFGGFDNTDSASFDNTGGGNLTANLNGANPSVKALSFSGTTAYDVAQGSSGSLTLKSDTGTATITNTATTVTETISAPVVLASANTTVSVGAGATLLVTGGVSGGNGVTKTGTGILDLNGAAKTVSTLAANDGTTNVNAILSGSPAVTVTDTGGGAPTKLRFGSVSQTLSSLTIGAGSTVIFTSGTASGAFSGGGKSASLGGGSAVVPEPGTLGLLLVGALGMLNRRRRQV